MKQARMYGGNLNALSCQLLERSIKTLDVRAQRQNKNAMAVAEFLDSHEAINRVLYPGLKSHPGHELYREQAGSLCYVVMQAWKNWDPTKFCLSPIVYSDCLLSRKRNCEKNVPSDAQIKDVVDLRILRPFHDPKFLDVMLQPEYQRTDNQGQAQSDTNKQSDKRGQGCCPLSSLSSRGAVS